MSTINSKQTFEFFNNLIDSSVRVGGVFEEQLREMNKHADAIKMQAVDKSFNATVAFLDVINDLNAELHKAVSKIAEKLQEDKLRGDQFTAEAAALYDNAKKLGIEFKVKSRELSGGLDENYVEGNGKAIINALYELVLAKNAYIEKIANEVAMTSNPDVAKLEYTLGGGIEKVQNNWVDVYDSWKATFKTVDVLLGDESEELAKRARAFDGAADDQAKRDASVNPIKM